MFSVGSLWAFTSDCYLLEGASQTISNIIEHNQYGIPLDPKTMKHEGFKPYIYGL